MRRYALSEITDYAGVLIRRRYTPYNPRQYYKRLVTTEVEFLPSGGGCSMRSNWSFVFIVVAAVAFGSGSRFPSQELSKNPQTTTSVIVFGVGSPNITADRSGTSIGIVVGGRLYLFDAGAAVERRIMEATPKLAALQVQNFGPVFLTHLDMDHTLGLATLLYYHSIAAPGRLTNTSDSGTPLNVYGPGPVGGPPDADRAAIGIDAVMNHLQTAFAQQPFARGISGSNLQYNPVVHSTEITPGIVYRDSLVTVSAFKVSHKTAIAFGFRIQTADRVIVISGDTSPVEAVIDACSGCDLLFHEVFSLDFGPQGPRDAAQGHTSALELGEIARRARPKHLVIYHDVRIPSPAAGLDAIRKGFSGKVTFAQDLDTF